MDVAIRRRAQRRRVRGCEEHQPAVDARRPGAVLPVRPSGDHEHLPAQSSPAASRRSSRTSLTGVSGITALSPAMSAGRRPRDLQRLRRGRLQRLCARDRRGSWPATPPVELPRNAAILPPRPHGRGTGLTRRSSNPNARRCRRGDDHRGAGRDLQAEAVARFRRSADRSAWAQIRSAHTPPAGCRSSSATCSATTRW